MVQENITVSMDEVLGWHVCYCSGRLVRVWECGALLQVDFVVFFKGLYFKPDVWLFPDTLTRFLWLRPISSNGLPVLLDSFLVLTLLYTWSSTGQARICCMNSVSWDPMVSPYSRTAVKPALQSYTHNNSVKYTATHSQRTCYVAKWEGLRKWFRPFLYSLCLFCHEQGYEELPVMPVEIDCNFVLLDRTKQ